VSLDRVFISYSHKDSWIDYTEDVSNFSVASFHCLKLSIYFHAFAILHLMLSFSSPWKAEFMKSNYTVRDFLFLLSLSLSFVSSMTFVFLFFLVLPSQANEQVCNRNPGTEQGVVTLRSNSAIVQGYTLKIQLTGECEVFMIHQSYA
jgi:hypothetical protein